MNKEQNFISAVVYISDDNEQTIRFFETLNNCLDEHFLQYELIAVNGDSSRNSARQLREWAKTITKPLTLVNMSLRQPLEQCMNAGIDIAIGDYVYEFDSTDMPYDSELIWKAYELAQEGNDIVSVCPEQESAMSHLFYKVFNAHSNSGYNLHTDIFRLTSRRAINRAHSINENLPYRKAAYAASGLKSCELFFCGRLGRKQENRMSLAINSIVLYTDYGYRVSTKITLIMLLISFITIVYAVFAHVTSNPASGWASIVCILSIGLTGLFAIMAIAVKYLSLILMLTFKKQNYLIESIEKL